MSNCLTVACAFAHLVFAPGSTEQQFPDQLVPTWVAPAGDDLLIASSYNSIYRLSGTTLERLAVPPDLKFVPAGMTERDGKLYVANYLGKDVLVFDYPSMHLRQRITDGLVGPEGVYVDENGAIDVADFDGGKIARFSADGTALWSRPLKSAHGVTQVGGKVFATSLYDRSVVAFDAATGAPLGTAGSRGSGVGQYLWPVGMAADGDGVLVIDSMLGRVTRLSGSLDIEAVLPSGNGPGEDLFAYPYGIVQHQGGYIVADTFKHRLVFVDDAWRVTRRVSFGPPPRGRDLPILRPFDNPRGESTFEPAPPLGHLLGVDAPGQMVEGYNSLDLVRDGRVAIEFAVNSGAVNMPFFYWTWARQAGDFVIIGSAAQGSVMVIDTKTFRIGYAATATDVWTLRGERDLRFPDGTFESPDRIVQSARWIDLTDELTRKIATSPAAVAYLKDRDLAAYLKALAKLEYISVPELVAIRHMDQDR